MRRHVLVLGDQLTRVVGPLAGADPATTTVLLVESDAWARRRPYHRQKRQPAHGDDRRWSGPPRRGGALRDPGPGRGGSGDGRRRDALTHGPGRPVV